MSEFEKAMGKLRTSLKKNGLSPEQIEDLADSLHSFKPVLERRAEIQFIPVVAVLPGEGLRRFRKAGDHSKRDAATDGR